MIDFALGTEMCPKASLKGKQEEEEVVYEEN